MTTMPQSNFNLTVQRYNALPGVASRLVPLSGLIVALCLYAVYRRFSIFAALPGELTALHVERTIYVAYASIFVTMWALYFLSRSDRRFFQVRTLRRLLLGTTENWAGTIKEYLAEGIEEEKKLHLLDTFEHKFKEKSTSSMTNLGMLIGAAALELSQISVVSHWHTDDGVWSRLTLGIGAIAAISALICFIVAADSLDSLFNHFRSTSDRHILIRYFYIQSVNPRYIGLMSVLIAATMLVADISPSIGAVSVAIIASAGYTHWFPAGINPETVLPPRPLIRTLVMVALIILPLVPRFLPICQP